MELNDIVDLLNSHPQGYAGASAPATLAQPLARTERKLKSGAGLSRRQRGCRVAL